MRFLTMLVLVALFSFTAPVRAEVDGGLTIGDVAPDGQAAPLGGGAALTLSATQGQKAMLLVIFGTYCPHCQVETKALNQLFATLDPNKVAILAVGMGDTDAKVARFKERFACKYPLAVDENHKLQRPFNIVGVPTYFVLDSKRVVRAQGNAESFDVMNAQIQKVLGQ